jgi:UDP-glucose 4-epimerase
MLRESLLITGVGGFLGGKLASTIGHGVGGVIRRSQLDSYSNYLCMEINSSTDYADCLDSREVIIHCAARVHLMNDTSPHPLSSFREVNTAGTLNLARQAAQAGVKRFIYISSIKVNGSSTVSGCRFTSNDIHKPDDPYGISKAEAETGLLLIAKETKMEVVIIRPPLVYGPRVRGNFLNLLKLSKLPIPLPFGLINNKRSMVYLDNLVDLIITCIDHPDAVNRIFLVSDGDDLSLARLLTLIRISMNKSPLLLPVPIGLFKLLGMLFGKSAIVERLIGNLQVDSSDAKALLNWQPPYTVEQGIKATVDDFLKNK